MASIASRVDARRLGVFRQGVGDLRPAASPAELARARRFADHFLRLGLLVACACQAGKRLADLDLPWHLALGRHVIDHLAIPAFDPLAHAHRPVEYMEFVSDILLYALMRTGGPLALQLFGALLFAVIAVLLLDRGEPGDPMAVVVIASAMASIAGWILVRPATLSFALLALTTNVIERHRVAPHDRRARLALLALCPLMALWANLHGFVVLGLAVLGLHAAYATACRAAAGRLGRTFPASDGHHWRTAVAAAAIATLCAGANLAGFRLLTGPLRASADFERIAEWQRPTFAFLVHSAPEVLVFAAVALVALVAGRFSRPRRALRGDEIGLLVLAAVLAQSAFRMIPVAVILAAPVVAARLASMAQPSVFLHRVAPVLMLLVGPVMLVQNPTSFGVGFEPAHFPERAVRFVEQSQPRGRMYNFLDFGGYLAWRLHPTYTILVDGRSGWVHDQQFLGEYHASLRDPEAFASVVRTHNLDWALVRAKPGETFAGPLARSPDWTMVYLDELSAVYVRDGQANDPLAARGYRALRHVTSPAAALDAAITGRARADALAHDGQLAVAQAPADPRAWFFEAAGAIANGDAARWRLAHARLQQLAPGPLLDAFAHHAP